MNTLQLDAIQKELVRLQLHPVNLGVTEQDERLVALHGSLLQYWNQPAVVDGKWLIGILRGLPDAAGAEVVMSALSKASVSDPTNTSEALRADAARIARLKELAEAGMIDGPASYFNHLIDIYGDLGGHPRRTFTDRERERVDSFIESFASDLDAQ